ncbi:TPA: hypothetical protein ACRZSU_000114 [Campylobacter jejuni]
MKICILYFTYVNSGDLIIAGKSNDFAYAELLKNKDGAKLIQEIGYGLSKLYKQKLPISQNLL